MKYKGGNDTQTENLMRHFPKQSKWKASQDDKFGLDRLIVFFSLNHGEPGAPYPTLSKEEKKRNFFF